MKVRSKGMSFRAGPVSKQELMSMPMHCGCRKALTSSASSGEIPPERMNGMFPSYCFSSSHSNFFPEPPAVSHFVSNNNMSICPS